MFPPEENRSTVIGEYGGFGLPIAGHLWQDTERNWGYGAAIRDGEHLLETYKLFNARLHPLIAAGLSAAVYTQTTDVEVEVNGMMTYDRAVIKVDVERFRAANEALRYEPATFKVVVPTAREEAAEWAYTIFRPGDGWEKPDFDDSEWNRGPSGFGSPGTPNAVIGTEWRTDDIWIRRSFELSAEDAADPSSLFIDLHHDEDATVYINGVKVLETQSFITDYHQFPMENAAEAIKAGTNVIAIRCRQTTGGQYIDAGISRFAPPENRARVW